MSLYSIPSLPIHRWVIGRGLLFALLGLLAVDGGLCITSAFAQEIGPFPSNLAFSGTVGGANPAAQSFPITNTGGGTLSWTVSPGAAWLQFNPTSGTTTTETDTISASVTTSGLAAGTYKSFIAVTAPGAPSSPRYIPVSLTLTTATSTSAIGLNPAALTFTGTAGGANPAAQSVGISNTGGGTLTWTASDNATWLTLAPASGTNAGSVSASVNLSGLAAGTYNATVTVAATGATTKTLPVTLTISPAGAAAGFSLSPATLAYSATVGSPNKSGSVTVTNTGSTAITVTWADSINWLVAITPGVTQTIQPGLSGTFTLTASFGNLAAGSYSGTATISGGGITKQVPVTLTLTTASSTPAIGLNPAALTFTGTAGGANPAAQSVGISNTGGGTLTWTASDNATWLTLAPASGTNAGSVSASVNLSGLAAGTYNATVTVAATGATTKTLPVTLTISPAGAAAGFSLSPATLAYSATVGSPNKSGSVTVTNTGSTAITVTWADSINWLVAITPGVTQTIQPGLSGTFTLTASFGNLAAGSYSGTATISGGGITKQVPVTLTLTTASSTPAIGLSTTSLGFAGTVGGMNPSAQTIAVSNVGGGTLTWSAGSNTTWLSLSPVSGTNAGTVTATVNLAGLLAGSYAATVTVTATGATTKTIPVTLTVMAATSTPAIGLSTTSLGFAGTVGGTNPAAQTIAISNVGSGTLTWSVGSNAPWLTLSPVSGTNAGTVTVTVNLAGLVAGSYTATVTVTATGATTKTIPVTLTLTAATSAANQAVLSWKANTDSDLAGYKVYQGTSSGTYAAPVATIPKGTTSYTATGLKTGTTYFFAITAYDTSANESPFSPEVSKSIY